MPDIQLQIMSDLHLEAPAAYDTFEIVPQAPILALLGDIEQVIDPGWTEFLERQLSLFSVVLLVLGNHEAYHSDWTAVYERIRNFNETYEQKRSAGQGSLVLLDKGRFDVSDDVTILGCTLHSGVDTQHEEHVSFGVNDFYYIGDWMSQSTAKSTAIDWLDDQVTSIARASPHRRIAILTHHSPCIDAKALDPKHASSPLTSAFATDLSGQPCWTSDHVKLWAFGHTHFNCPFVDPKSRKQVLTNQRGYYFAQAAGFDPSKVITI